MNLLIIVAKIALVAFFLVMFLRSSKVFWGIGLLTVTSAILLDAFLSTFGRDEMVQELGFFLYAFAGALFAGAALWLWGILSPYLAAGSSSKVSREREEARTPVDSDDASNGQSTAISSQPAGIEGQRSAQLDQLSYEDLLDLEFDMGYRFISEENSENEKEELSRAIIGRAESDAQMDQLRLAVERIQNPLPPEHLPRIENITLDSPRTVVRQFMLANYNDEKLQQISSELGIEWSSIQGGTQKAQVRSLLLAIDKGDQKGELIDVMQRLDAASSG